MNFPITAVVFINAIIGFLPAMNSLFHSAPIDLAAWWRILAFSALAYLLVGVEKQITNRMRKPNPEKGTSPGFTTCWSR